MKISKQLLKEIIREEYTFFLCEQLVCEGMVKDVIQRAIEDFGAAVQEMDTKDASSYGAKKSRLMSYEAIRILASIVRALTEEKFMEKEASLRKNIDYHKQNGPWPPYGLWVIEALDTMLAWAKAYETTGEESSDLSNEFSIALNMATKNVNRRAWGEMPLKPTARPSPDDTQAFASE
jgi:hypothetical protein